MSRSVDNYYKKRELILHAAAGLFITDGYDGTGMDDVALSAGVTKQTVYRYFESKVELFCAVADEYIKKPAGHRFGRSGVLEELMRFGECYMSACFSEDSLGFWRLAIAESRAGSPVADIMRKMPESLSENASLVGFMRDRLALSDPVLYSRMFLAMLTSARESVLAGNMPAPDSYEIRKHAELTAEIFVNGVLGL